MNPFNYSAEQLQATALDVRRDIITMLVEAKSGHTGGPLSCTDFATALSFRILNHKTKSSPTGLTAIFSSIPSAM